MPFTYEYPRPAVTVDVALFGLDGATPRVLLIQRKHDPFAGRWALPGGFVDMDEEIEVAARRELLEEANVDVGELLEVAAFGAPGRDPRGRTISIVYAAVACGELPRAREGDDAAAVRWHAVHRLPELAFDHRDVVRRTLQRLAEVAENPARLARLLPREFTAKELRQLVAFATGDDAPASLVGRLRRQGALQSTGKARGRETLHRLRRTR